MVLFLCVFVAVFIMINESRKAHDIKRIADALEDLVPDNEDDEKESEE